MEGDSLNKSNSGSRMQLKLQLNISSTGLLGVGGMIDDGFGAVREPVDVTIVYPDDIKVTVDACIARVEELVEGMNPGGVDNGRLVQGRKSSGRLEMQQVECKRCKKTLKLKASNAMRNSGGDGKVNKNFAAAGDSEGLPPQDIEEESSDDSRDEVTKNQLVTKRKFFIDAMEDTDNSIYHSMLQGNDSMTGHFIPFDKPGGQFGDLSSINNIPPITPGNAPSELASTRAHAGSGCQGRMDDFDESPFEDEQDGIYPTLPTRDLEEEELKRVQGEDVTGHVRQSLRPIKEDDEREDEDNDKDINSDQPNEDSDVKKLIYDILDKVHEKDDDDNVIELIEEKKVSEKPKLIGAIANLSMNVDVPMKSRKYVQTDPVLVVRTKKGQKPSQHEGIKRGFVKGLGITRGTFPTSAANQQSSDRIENENYGRSGLDVRELKQSSCGHNSGGHACHICINVPEEAVNLIKQNSGLDACAARKAAFVFIHFMKEKRHTDGVQNLLKYISGLAFDTTSVKKRVDPYDARPMSSPVQQEFCPNSFSKEHQFKNLLQALFRQKGAWTVFEDDEIVEDHLKCLNDFLHTFDKSTLKKIMKEDRYESVKGMCIYFALEKRWTVRNELLEALDLIATKDANSFSVMISSDLPVDLAGAIEQEYIENENGTGRMIAYGEVLLTLLGTGNSLQVDHLERITADFVYCLVQIAEGNMTNGVPSVLRDLAVNLILAYNLQFSDQEHYSNKVINALAVVKEAEYLKQKMLLYMLNRNVSSFQNMKLSHPSFICSLVVKLATDILQCGRTNGFFIDADLNILFASLGSYIPELEPGDWKRTAALRLARVVLQHASFQQNGFRQMIRALKGILTETVPEARIDQKVARKMAKEMEHISHSYRQTPM